MITTGRHLGRLPLVLSLTAALLAAACTESDQQPLFQPEIGHPENWISDHGKSALEEGSTCPECHGADLGGGASQVSCFSPQESGVSCHEGASGSRHTTGWELATEHGRAAKGRPGISSGIGACQACHGDDYQGGTSGVACSSCHNVPAPHPSAPWLQNPGSHATTNEQNAPQCAECHRRPEVELPPGCTNGSLCHNGRETHPADWALPKEHGAKAKESNVTGGFLECQSCHGVDFLGGTTGVSCFTCHGLEAPHPGKGWIDGGASHKSTAKDGAVICSACHLEMAEPGDCFTSNACHDGAKVEEDPATEEKLDEGVPADD